MVKPRLISDFSESAYGLDKETTPLLSDRLQSQINALKSIPDGIISDVDGYRQTAEDPKTLVPDPENANIHTDENLAAIGHSLNAFGFRKKCDRCARGNPYHLCRQRHRAVVYPKRCTGLPVVWIPASMTEAEAKAFALADNQSAKLAEWDFEQIEETLDGIKDEFSPEALGFDPDELQEAFEEMSNVDEAVVNMRNTAIKKEKPKPAGGLVKLLLLPSELPVVEKALRAAKQPSRGEALTLICKQFLEQQDGKK